MGVGYTMEMTASPVGFHRTIAGDLPAISIDRLVEERLRRSGYLALRDVRCVTQGDSQYLHGGVPSYFLKQLAQEVAGEVEGVRKVVNRIEVLRRTGDRAARA
jgi:hypothetical protein